MHTLLLAPTQLKTAATLLHQGECVAFPTETVYGLGANALDRKAVAKIFLAKGRPPDNPLSIHCYNRNQLEGLVTGWPPEAEALMEAFWPGPLSLVLKKKPAVPDIVTGGLDTVALRFPKHPVALRLMEMAGLPIAAPSANISGKPSPTRAEHVLADMDNKIAAIVDGGPTPGGLESTVLDCTVYPFVILRPGGITLEELQAIVPSTIGKTTTTISPGMKYKHYAPKAKVFLVTGAGKKDAIQERITSLKAKGLKIAVMAFAESDYVDAHQLNLGKKTQVGFVATNLYHLLREADTLGFDVVFIEGLSEEGLGYSIMDRLRQAADHEIHT